MLVGPELARWAAAGLDLVYEEHDVVLLANGLKEVKKFWNSFTLTQ